MKAVISIIFALGLAGCVSSPRATYEIGYEDRGDLENRWSVEPGLEASLDSGGNAGVSYRYREGEDTDNEEHGVFVKGAIPLGG